MKNLFLLLSAITISLALFSCNPQPVAYTNYSQAQSPQVDVQQTVPVQNFDAQGFGNLVKQNQNPQALENALNTPNNGINNMDLDNDGQADYLNVVENGPNQLSVVDNNTNVCNVNISNVNNQAYVQIVGVPTYCGQNYNYSYYSPMTSFLLWHYMFSHHSYYHSPYHYGYYPRTYHRTTVVRTRTITRTQP